MTDQLIQGPYAARSTLGGSPFPPIADYGFLSHCEVSALVAPSGNIEWMCLPRMDGPSVFAAMLDRGAGWFRLGPADLMVPSGRRYLPGTMVLETTWGSRARGRSRGAACGPASGSSARCPGTTGPRRGPSPKLISGWRTADFWHEWLGRGNFPDHLWRKVLQLSALTLKGLIYAPTGALLAAATSSLPETPGGQRNYDCRFTWLRDLTFMLWGLYTLGLDREADDFFYLHHRPRRA